MAQEVFVACSDDDLGCRCALFRLLFIEGRRPGVRPGGRGTFLCFAKAKYPKERRPEVRATSWFPALLAPGGVSLNSLRSNRREPLSTCHSAARPCPTGKAGSGAGELANALTKSVMVVHPAALVNLC